MIRMFIITTAIALAGCTTYEPIVDLRASEDKAQLFQRDLNECRQLVDPAKSIWTMGDEYWVIEMINNCLTGRGHSVL